MSLQFDAEYYLTNNPDVAEAVQNGVIESAEAHWEMYGADEGRNPNAVFNTEEYLAANPDVADAFAKGIINPLDHFLQYGAAEGRAPSAAYQNVAANFDNDAYLAANTDVAEAVDNGVFASGYEHWVEYGQFEETRTGAQLTDGTPADEAIGEEATTELTTEVDTLTGTAADDIFSGVSSALSSARTLNAGDSIDGGDGNDTLSVDLQSTFSGFNADGGLTSVENLELNNAGSIARGFDASGIEGLEQVTLNGDVNLTNVETAGITLALADIAEGSTGVEFTADAIKGKSDSLALALENVGTVADEENDVAEQAVAITANGIESLSVAAEGDNVVDLSGIAATDATVTGSGNLTVTAVNAKLETFDASAAEGDVDADLSDAGSLGSVTTGAGDDTLSIDTDSLTANAMIDGGEGDNTLALSGSSAKATQYQLANVQTLSLGDFNSGALTFSARDTSDLETVAAGSDFSGTATLAGLGTQDMAFALEGGASTQVSKMYALKSEPSNQITADHGGVSTINVAASEDATATQPETSGTTLKLTQSSAVDLTVGEYVNYTGNITAQKAQSLEVAVAGEINNTINAANATGAVFDLTNEDAASSVDLVAQKLVDLNVTAASDFNMGGSALGALESLTVDTDGAFTASNVTLGAINAVELSGNGSANLGALGSGTNDQYGITVNAEGLNDGLTLSTITTNGTDIDVNAADVQGDVTLNGAVNAGTGNVDLDLANVAGNVTLDDVTGNNVAIDVTNVLGQQGVTYGGTISVADSVTLNGAELSGNTATIAATGNSLTATLNGGLGADQYTLNLTNSDLKNVDLNGDLGIQGSGESDSFILNFLDGDDNTTDSGDGTADSYTGDYNVSGVENLKVHFNDANDTLTLSSGSSMEGVTSLTVENGTLDVSALANASDFDGLTNVTIGSGLKLTAAQFANVTSIETTSDDARIDIKIDTAEQAQQVAEVLNNNVTFTGDKLSNIGLQVAQSVVNNETALNALKAAAEKQASKVTQETVNDAGETTDTDVSGTLTVQEAQDAQAAGTLDESSYSIQDSASAIATAAVDGATFANATSITANTAELTVEQAQALEGLAALDSANSAYTLADSADAIAAVTDWTQFGNATTVTAQDASLDASTAETLEGMVTNGDVDSATYTLSDDADAIATAAVDGATFANATSITANTAELTVEQAQALEGLAALDSANSAYTIVDSVTSLTGDVVTPKAATSVTAKLESGNTDLSNVTLDNDVTAIDLNGQDATLSAAQATSSLNFVDSTDSDLSNNLVTVKLSSGDTTDFSNVPFRVRVIDNSGNVSTITGGANGDILRGMAGDDTLHGGDGNDDLQGGVGTDILNGGAGDDTLRATADGNDTLNGDAGNDTFVLNQGTNAAAINGGDGEDTLQITGDGTGTTDSPQTFAIDFSGKTIENVEILDFADGGDSVANQTVTFDASAYASFTSVTGTGVNGPTSQGNDTIIVNGADEGDTITGLNVAEQLNGGNGADTITGGAGNDVIYGREGADTMTGGAGNDVFAVAAAQTGTTVETADTITDFETGVDVIDAQTLDSVTVDDGSSYTAFSDFVSAAEESFVGNGSADGFVAYNSVGSGNAYVAIDEDGDGTFGDGDSLVVLTGIDQSTEIATTDIA